jgi:hypothetical protein
MTLTLATAKRKVSKTREISRFFAICPGLARKLKHAPLQVASEDFRILPQGIQAINLSSKIIV